MRTATKARPTTEGASATSGQGGFFRLFKHPRRDITAQGELIMSYGKRGAGHETRVKYFLDLLDQTGGRGWRS